MILTYEQAEARVSLIIKKMENAMNKATIYTRTGCAECKKARKHLEQCGYTVTEKNVETELPEGLKTKIICSEHKAALPIVRLYGGKLYTGKAYMEIQG